MRVCLTTFTLLLAAAVGVAAVPLPPPAPPSVALNASTTTPDPNEVFANSLLLAVNWVANIYVRPVSRAELLHSALIALYDAARRPAPSDLRRRIERADKKATALTQQGTSVPLPVPLIPAPRRMTVSDDRPLLDLIRTVRSETGDAEKFGGEPALRLCCHTMLRKLDPYSGVVAPGENNRALSLRTEYDGFGLTVRDGGGRIVVKDVLPGGPAQKAGLRPGDEIVRVRAGDGRDWNTPETLALLNGRLPLLKPDLGILTPPESIEAAIRRRGDKKEHRVTLPWQHFRPESVFGVARRDDNSWNYWLDAERKIAHLRLGALAEATPDELSDIIEELRREGLRGLILDLRWCPGGSLKGSVKSAELFLGEGVIATVHYPAVPEEVFRSVDEDKLTGFPMVVLVNGDSTGGAEMIAAALQDHHRAVLVGQRTHGKGNVQRLQSIGSLALKVTSGTIVRPNGKTLHRFPDSKKNDDWGVHPDRVFRVSPDLTRAVKTWWEKQTLRPGSSVERLPLDDPLADPQRNAALETLMQMIHEE